MHNEMSKAFFHFDFKKFRGFFSLKKKYYFSILNLLDVRFHDLFQFTFYVTITFHDSSLAG
jgi:hypothetical protein